MYAIAEVIYGFPLVAHGSEDSPREKFPVLQDAVEEEEVEGFLTYYYGSSDEEPAAFGIKLDGFDESYPYTGVSQLTLAPSAEQIQQYNDLLTMQEPDVRAALENLGEPRVFFLWTTS